MQSQERSACPSQPIHSTSLPVAHPHVHNSSICYAGCSGSTALIFEICHCDRNNFNNSLPLTPLDQPLGGEGGRADQPHTPYIPLAKPFESTYRGGGGMAPGIRGPAGAQGAPQGGFYQRISGRRLRSWWPDWRQAAVRRAGAGGGRGRVRHPGRGNDGGSRRRGRR